MDKVVACETCGLVQEVDHVPLGSVVKCSRCNFQIFHRRVDSRSRTLAFSLAAAILYFPSNLYPIVTAEYQGQAIQTTIFQGIKSLWEGDQYFIASLVFCTSLFTPALKIMGLIFITLTLDWERFQKTRAWMYKIIRIIDPWNMLEVFLLAICVSMVEMGEVATVHPGRGVFSFAAVVVLTLAATLSFDSRLLWDSPRKENIMSNHAHTLPKAKIQKDALSWFFWTLPICAALLCGWFLLHDFVFSGPTLTIYFQDANGLQEKNTMVKYRGIQIGQIETLKLTDKGGRVLVQAKLDHSAANVARQGSVFWIVHPQVKLGAISGLQTIVSGNYITVQPGNGERTNIFVGAEEAPVQPEKGVVITLLADSLGGLEKQSEIFYRGIQVGEVVDFWLDQNARYVLVHARIREAYAPLVRVDSKFWNAGGINAHLGLFRGLDITAESAQTLVSGGIAFATPVTYGAAATNGSVFVLNQKEDTAWEDWNPQYPLTIDA